MFLEIKKCDSVYILNIDGTEITNVEKYKIITSESGETEVELKLRFNAQISFNQMSSNQA